MGEESEDEGGEEGFEIKRYRIGDALRASCAADAEAKSTMNVLGVGVRGLYCQLTFISSSREVERVRTRG